MDCHSRIRDCQTAAAVVGEDWPAHDMKLVMNPLNYCYYYYCCSAAKATWENHAVHHDSYGYGDAVNECSAAADSCIVNDYAVFANAVAVLQVLSAEGLLQQWW